MAINKVEYGGKILIDLTQDTVTPETLAKGEIAHNAAGEQITGTMESGGGGGDSDLPQGYRRADYIQFANAQIVDTGIICNRNTKIKVIFTRETTNSVYLYGVANTGNTASVTAYVSNGGYWRFGNKYTTRQIAVSEEIPRTHIVTATGVQHETGTAALSGVTEFETIGTLLLGACRDADGTLPADSSAKYTGKVFLFEMWDGDTQVLKLIPVVDANGNYHLWDMVSQKAFDSITGVLLNGGNL